MLLTRGKHELVPVRTQILQLALMAFFLTIRSHPEDERPSLFEIRLANGRESLLKNTKNIFRTRTLLEESISLMDNAGSQDSKSQSVTARA